MFGELDDSDIYENGPNGGFDNNTDANSGYSYGNSDDTSSDDFLDMSSYEEPSSSSNYGQETGGVLGSGAYNVPPQQNMNTQSNEAQGDFIQGAAPSQQPPKKSSSLIYILLLGLVFIAAAGMFFYKKNMAQSEAPAQDQAMGDYFYDQTAADAPKPAAEESAPAGTATIDVDLANGAAVDKVADKNAPAAVKEDPEKARLEKMEKEGKELNAVEKALLKKKKDEAKENQVTLSARPVIIPVSAGGRVDPFLPYDQGVALANKPKFDIIAPPLELPAADPVVEEVIETKISGIMYDGSRPSAIVNIGGTDHLVHKGDAVNGCKILDITKNTVVIKYKSNIYQASVGQTLTEGVNLNPVSNIAKQFGGAYSKTPKGTIQFNK